MNKQTEALRQLSQGDTINEQQGAMPQFVVFQPPPEPWLKKSAKKIAGGLVLTAIVSIIANQGGFKWAAVTTAKIVVAIFDRHPKPTGPDLPRPGIPVTLPTTFPTIHRSPEELKAIADEKEVRRREAEEKEEANLKHKLDTWRARADAAGMPYDDDTPLGKFEVDVPIAEEKARYAEERKPLLAQARELKMEVDEEWDNKTFKEEIKLEKKFRLDDADYQEKLRRWKEAMDRYHEYLKHGPNSKCPTPRCGYETRFGSGRINTKSVCPKCHGIYPVRQFMASHAAPKPPVEPKPPIRGKSGVLDKVKGLFR